jgi:regulator of replication initiation timing
MADEAEDLGSEHIIEGGEEIMSAIDGLFAEKPAQEQVQTEVQTQEVQTETQVEGETADQQAERARNEKGQFTKEQQEEKERQEKAAQTQTTEGEKQYPAEIKSQKARDHFDALTKVKDEAVRKASSLEAKVKQFESQIAELQSKSGTASPEVKVLQQENAKLKADLEEREKILSFKAVEETTPYKEGVSIPQSEAAADMDAMAAQYQLDIGAINKVLAEPNKYKRNEMLADLTQDLPERSRLGVHADLKESVDKWLKAEQTRGKIYDQAKGNREFAEQERTQSEAKAALARQQEYQKANQEVDAIMKDKYPELAGDEALWGEITGKAFKVADFDKLPAKAKAFANVASWAFLKAMDKLRAETEAHKKTKEVMAARNGSSPSPTGGRATTSKQTVDETEDGGDPMAGLMGSLDSVFAGNR